MKFPRSRKIEISEKAGGVREAELMQCAVCLFEFFMAFQAEGQDHIHLQCGRCGVAYCQGDGCEKEIEEAELESRPPS